MCNLSKGITNIPTYLSFAIEATKRTDTITRERDMYQSLAKNFVMHASHNDIFIFHLNHSKAYVGLCNKLGCYFVQHFVIQLALFKSVCVCLTGSLSVCVFVCVRYAQNESTIQILWSYIVRWHSCSQHAPIYCM